jgi:aldehyde dehydrogenase (NAD+)
MNFGNFGQWSHFERDLQKGGRSEQERLFDLRLLRQGVVKNEKMIREALREDLGKSEFEAWSSEIGFVIQEIDHAMKNLEDWMRPRSVSTPLVFWPARSEIRRMPKGVGLIISPWNYPFQLAIGPLVGALAAGCPAILKPSELAPSTSRVLSNLIADNFTKDHVTVVEGDAAVAKSLLALPFQHIFFTGSTKIGREVMGAAAKQLASVTLELGGKSPVVVTRNARLRVSARRVMFGKILNAGQTCVAPDFVLVDRQVQEEFVAECRQALVDFLGKDPRLSPDWGRIVNDRHFDRLLGLLPDSLPEKAACRRDERYIPPVILDGSDWDQPPMVDEIFGPILPVLSFDRFEEALAALRKRPAPLAAYLFSEDSAEQELFTTTLLAGGMCINDTVLQVANIDLPFGGVGSSGMGASHGEASFLAFTHECSVMSSRSFPDVPLRYPPYSRRVLNLIRRL